MKKANKIISLVLAVIMVFSVIPFTAAASAINTSTYNTVEKLIHMNSLPSLLDYLVNQINANKDSLITPVLRIVFLAMNNEQINGYIGTKEVTKLTGKEASKVLVKWLDTDILPPIQEKLNESGAIETINNDVPGLTVDIHSVQSTFNTLAQLDSGLVGLATNLLGDAKDLDVSSVKNVTVAGNEDGAVKAVIQFLKDNLSTVHKALNGNISLGIVDNFFDVNQYISFIGDLPKLIKSFLYKMINPDAAAGEFAEGKMGGDWETSPYAGYNADELLGAALIKAINGTDDVISKSDAAAVTQKSFYDLLGDYAEPVFNKFALEPLNEAISNLNNWLAEQTNADLKALFNSPIAPLDSSTFSTIFANAKTTGLLEQLNNILLAALQHIFKANVYSAVNLTAGGNENLNANLTKIARYALPILVKLEDMMGYTFPAEIKTADPAKLSLADMATYILKPFFDTWFKDSANYNKTVVNSAKSLPALAVLAVNYTATNKEWMNLDYTFANVTANDIKDIRDAKATDKVMATAAGMAIGALKSNAAKIHFTATVDGSNWKTAFNQIANWGLDFIVGLPALVRTHDLKNQNSYGPFYKLNVILNELIDFSFLNDVNDATFKLDLETLLKEGVLQNLYEFDVAGIIHIFEKNSKDGNVLGGVLNTSVIGIVNRILTALFEHSCGSHGSASKTIDDPAAPCTKQIKYNYDYCKVCGAYFSRTESSLNKTRATHVFGEKVTKNEKAKPTAKACNYKVVVTQTCLECGYIKTVSSSQPPHKFNSKGICTVCNTSKYTPGVASVSKTKFTYTGKVQKPTITAKTKAGKTIESKYYTVKWSNSSSKAVGTYTVTVTFKGDYTGTQKFTYTIVPAKVKGVKKASATTKSIKLSWTKATGAKYYEVYGSTDGKTFKKITTVSTTSASITKVNGKAIKAGKTYYFKVRALDSSKKLIGAYSDVLKTGTKTAAPKISKLTSTKAKTATVTWGKVTGAKSYTVYKSTDGKKWTKVASTTKTTYTLTKLTGGKKIYVKVLAVNNYKDSSAYSAVKYVKVKK